MLVAEDCPATGTASDTLEDLEELARAWHGIYAIAHEGGEWSAEHVRRHLRVTAGTAAGLWTALWDAAQAIS